MVKDPVCGMEVGPSTEVLPVPGADVGRPGAIFYFCSPICRTTFLKSPEKFLTGERVPMEALQRRVLLYWIVVMAVVAVGTILVFFVTPSR